MLLIAACNRAQTLPFPPLSEGEAIRQAIFACNTPHLCTLGTPEAVTRRYVTLDEALDLAEYPEEKQWVQDLLNEPVWYIQLAGRFQI